MIPPRYRALTTGETSRAAISAGIEFVDDLWKYGADVFTFIATRAGKRWQDHAIQGPDRASQVEQILAAHSADKFDIYFCPYPFSTNRRLREYALPNCYAHCDIDLTDPGGYDPQPNILWETSPGRFQGLWKWRTVADAEQSERYSHAIVTKDGGDKGGWSTTKMLRLPGTINHKPAYDRPVVTLRKFDKRPQALPEPIKKLARQRLKFVPISQIGSGDDAATIMKRYRRKMGLLAGSLMTASSVLYTDRSVAVFKIVSGLIRAGAPDSDIVTVLLVNPYFLAKWGPDFARAEREVEVIRARPEGER